MGLFGKLFEGGRKSPEAESAKNSPDDSQEMHAPDGPVGMQHFGYDRVDGMESRFPQGGGPNLQSEREAKEDVIRRMHEEIANSSAEDAARIRRIRAQIETVKRDMNRG